MTSAGEPLILLVEDDQAMRKFLRASLISRGFRLLEAENAREARALATSHNPEIILLDLGLPDGDGIELTRELRAWSRVPIIVISARGREDDKVLALDSGADDYVTKPFGVNELLARVRVALRHTYAQQLSGGSQILDLGGLRIDFERRQVLVAEREVHLTPIEFRLLALLAQHADKVLTHRQLLKEVWGPGHVTNTHYLRVRMAELRRKIERDPARPEWLLTDPGVGYRLRPRSSEGKSAAVPSYVTDACRAVCGIRMGSATVRITNARKRVGFVLVRQLLRATVERMALMAQFRFSLSVLIRTALMLASIATCPVAARSQEPNGQSSAAPAQRESAPSPAPAPMPPRFRGFRLQAPELDAELRVRGLLQADGVFLLDDRSDQDNRFEIRRGRIAITGTVGRIFAFRIEPQYTPGNVVLLDAYADVRLIKEAFVLRAGKMKQPLGLEMAQSVSALIMPERGLATSLVPLRDIGAQLLGAIAGGMLEYALGIFCGAADGANPEGNLDDDLDVAARVFLQPFHSTQWTPLRKLGIGLAGSRGREHGTKNQTGLGSYRTVTRASFANYAEGVFADGRRYRWNAQLWWYWGPLGVLGEYVYSAQRVRAGTLVQTLGNQARVVAASYVLTQEDASFDGVLPRRAWGALEIGARYGELRFDDRAFADDFFALGAPFSARSWGVTLNYWANAVVRAQVAFERTTFGVHTGPIRHAENALFTRLQVAL